MPQPIKADEKINTPASIQVTLSKPASACEGPENKLAEPPMPPNPSPFALCKRMSVAVAIPVITCIARMKYAMTR